VADIADTHLTAWVEKKWYQRQHGFEMSDVTTELIQGRHPKKPRDLTIEMMSQHQQNGWKHKAEWFVKLLTYGARFPTEIYTRRVPLSCSPLLRLKRCHA
jgi:hypothetical protein